MVVRRFADLPLTCNRSSVQYSVAFWRVNTLNCYFLRLPPHYTQPSPKWIPRLYSRLTSAFSSGGWMLACLAAWLPAASSRRPPPRALGCESPPAYSIILHAVRYVPRCWHSSATHTVLRTSMTRMEYNGFFPTCELPRAPANARHPRRARLAGVGW